MKNDNKGRDIFFGLVALATLIVAIVGATLAYFSVMASSNEGAINATAATVSIEYLEGKQVTAQADKLIPANFDVVQGIYERNVKDATEKNVEDLIDTGNLCVDDSDKHYQVCSVYRFSIKSTSNRDVTARLNNEENGFTYLSYAVYDVTNKKWLTLNADGENDLALQKCTSDDKAGDEATKCSEIDNLTKQKKYISNSVFGLNTEGEFESAKLVSGVVQTYDIILFIKNIDANQNIDQGKNYRGHIVVDVVDGLGAGEKIEGIYDPNKN